MKKRQRKKLRKQFPIARVTSKLQKRKLTPEVKKWLRAVNERVNDPQRVKAAAMDMADLMAGMTYTLQRAWPINGFFPEAQSIPTNKRTVTK